MNIKGWPYTIMLDGDVGLGTQAWVTVDFMIQPSNEMLEEVRYGIESFIALAQAGGLGGDRLDPLQCTAMLSTKAPTLQGTRCVWELTAIAIDPRSLAVLFNMLTFLGKDIRAVDVQASGSSPRMSFSTDDMPPMWPGAPFDINDDRSGPNVEVQIEFEYDVPSSMYEIVKDSVETWLGCGFVQGYRDWTEPDDGSLLIPLTDPTFDFIYNDSLVGQFEDIGVINEGYDIFINLLMKLQATTPILSVEIL